MRFYLLRHVLGYYYSRKNRSISISVLCRKKST